LKSGLDEFDRIERKEKISSNEKDSNDPDDDNPFLHAPNSPSHFGMQIAECGIKSEIRI
jgi:hypothetical protein